MPRPPIYVYHGGNERQSEAAGWQRTELGRGLEALSVQLDRVIELLEGRESEEEKEVARREVLAEVRARQRLER